MSSTTPPSSIPKVAQVLFSVDQGIAHITFDHVAARNAMTNPLKTGWATRSTISTMVKFPAGSRPLHLVYC
jgi:hypothetical protein